MNIEDLVALYKEGQSTKAIAEQLGCSDRTVRRYLSEAGVERRHGPKRQLEVGASHDRGCLGLYMRQHLEEELPHSLRKIASLTGCTKDEIKCYLYRKRAYMRKFLASLPALDEVNIILPTTQGFKVPTKAFSAYKIYLNKWKFTVKIVAWLKMNGKKVTIEVSPSVIRNRLRYQK